MAMIPHSGAARLALKNNPLSSAVFASTSHAIRSNQTHRPVTRSYTTIYKPLLPTQRQYAGNSRSTTSYIPQRSSSSTSNANHTIQPRSTQSPRSPAEAVDGGPIPPTSSRNTDASPSSSSSTPPATSPVSTTSPRSPAESLDGGPIPPSTTPTTLDPTALLTWNKYFTLRRIRRRYNTLSSLLLSTSTTLSGLITVTARVETSGFEQFSFFGFDPFFCAGLTIIAAAGGGWLSGPLLGSSLFNLMYRKERKAMEGKEKEFFERVRKYRVDPAVSSPSAGNPVPDYYGEKVGSVKDWRNWLRDQRAFNKKRRELI